MGSLGNGRKLSESSVRVFWESEAVVATGVSSEVFMLCLEYSACGVSTRPTQRSAAGGRCGLLLHVRAVVCSPQDVACLVWPGMQGSPRSLWRAVRRSPGLRSKGGCLVGPPSAPDAGRRRWAARLCSTRGRLVGSCRAGVRRAGRGLVHPQSFVFCVSNCCFCMTRDVFSESTHRESPTSLRGILICVRMYLFGQHALGGPRRHVVIPSVKAMPAGLERERDRCVLLPDSGIDPPRNGRFGGLFAFVSVPAPLDCLVVG